MSTLAKTPRTTKITVSTASAGPFDLSFRLFDDDAVSVYVNGLVRTDWALSSNYLNGFDDNASITFDASLLSGDVVVIDSDLAPARAEDYVNGPGLVDKMNIEFSRVWSVIADVKRDSKRSARFFGDVLPVEISAERAIVGNGDGSGVAMGPTVTEISNAQSYSIEARAYADAASAYAPQNFVSVSYLLADTTNWVEGTTLVVKQAGFSYTVAAASATDHHIERADGLKLYANRSANGQLSTMAFGAGGAGLTDDTAAVALAQAAAQAMGCSLWDEGYMFLVDDVTILASTYGGTYKRAGGTGDTWAQTGADNLTISASFDENDTAGHAFVVAHDGIKLKRNATFSNGFLNGIKHISGNGVQAFCHVENCRQAHWMTIVSTGNITGLHIDITVDGTGIGVANQNGGIKAHGDSTYAVMRPYIRGTVDLYEGADVADNCVGIETHTNVVAPVVFGTVSGGNISCTLNNSPNGVAMVQGRGAKKVCLEIAEGSHGARFVAGSRAEAGDTVTPTYAGQIVGADNAQIDALALTGSTANYYADDCDAPHFTGLSERDGGSQFVRLRGVTNARFDGLTCRKTGTTNVTRFVLADSSTALCNGMNAVGLKVSGITNFIQNTAALTGGKFSSCQIDNSGLFLAGGGTIAFLFADCDITTLPFGARADTYRRVEYVGDLDSVWEAEGDGVPENYMSAGFGARYLDRLTGNHWEKQTASGSAGWVIPTVVGGQAAIADLNTGTATVSEVATALNAVMANLRAASLQTP